MCIRDSMNTILSIFNEEILHGTSNYSYDPMSEKGIQSWFQEKQKNKRPVIVAEQNNQCIGFATYDQFRKKVGYRFTMEHSVYLLSNQRGNGIGSQLMQELIRRAKEDGMHSLIGVVDANNDKSIRFHEELGFINTGMVKEVGYKFDQWLDIVILQKIL